jgi:hypothetical protein
MANTSKRRLKRLLLELAEQSEKPQIKLEAAKLLILLLDRAGAAKISAIDPDLASALGLKED